MEEKNVRIEREKVDERGRKKHSKKGETGYIKKKEKYRQDSDEVRKQKKKENESRVFLGVTGGLFRRR